MMPRLSGIDVARGLALLAIIVNHIFYVSNFPLAQAFQDYHAIAFMLLAGLVFTYAESENYNKLKNVVRGTVCIVAGLLLGSGNPRVDVILLNYGIVFIIAAFLIPKLSKQKMLITSLVWMAVTPVLSYFIRGVIGTSGGPNIGVRTFITEPWLVITDPIFSSHYPVFQWFGVFLFGCWLGKQWREGKEFDAIQWLKIGALTFLGSKLISIIGLVIVQKISFIESVKDNFQLLTGNVSTENLGNLFNSSGYAGTTFALLSSLSVALMGLAICMKLIQFMPSFAKVGEIFGQQTLSLYFIHVFVFLVTPLFIIDDYSYLYYVATVILLALITVGWNMLRAKTTLQAPGPLEALTQFIIKTEQKKREAVASS